MSAFLYHIRTHALAYVLAAIIGIICIAPYVYFAMTPEYRGIALIGQDAEDHYLARMQEVYDGHPATGNVFLPYKDTPYLIPPLGENIVALLGKVFFMTAAQVNVFAKFLFPFLAFLFVYALGFAMTGSPTAGLLGATLAMLGTDFMSYPRDMLALLRGGSAQDGIYWARPINPEVSGAVLFGALWLIYCSFIKREAARWFEIVAIALLFGLSVYISPYTWSFLGMLLLLLCGHALWQKKFTRAKQIFSAGALGALCAISFISNYISAVHAPGYAYAALQQGVLHSHAPVFGVWVFVLLLVPLIAWPKQLHASRIFFIASAAALLLVLNQQVLTGVYLQPGHFHWYITKPLTGLMLGVWGVLMMERFVPQRWIRLGGYTIVIIVLVAGAALAQVRFYRTHAPDARAAQSYAPLLAYLRGGPPAVVFADTALSAYIPIYTSDDAPGDAYANMYIAPIGYFDTLSSVEQSAALTAQPLRDLGITLAIRDTQTDTWQPGVGLKKQTTIASRFEVYSFATSSSLRR